jgi:hypothetical protein
MNSDLELERAPRLPSDQPCGGIGEEDMGDKSERQADDADIQHESVEKEHPNDALPCPRSLA